MVSQTCPSSGSSRCTEPELPRSSPACCWPSPAEHRRSPPTPHDPAREKRLEWFREAKYGLFIHWGLYAIPAGEWNGQRSLGLGEWIMNRSQIPVKEYETARHAVQPGQVQRRRVGPARPGRGHEVHRDHLEASRRLRDVQVEGEPVQRRRRDAVQARRAEGARRRVRAGAACGSASTTRSRRTGTSRTAPATPGTSARIRDPTERTEAYDEYLRGKAEPQVRELLTGYGPVALIWFDTPRMMTAERGAALHRHRPHRSSPNTLIDGRLGTEGDYRSTGDNVIPPRVHRPRRGKCRRRSTTPGASAATTPTGNRPGRSPSSSSTSSARAATTC